MFGSITWKLLSGKLYASTCCAMSWRLWCTDVQSRHYYFIIPFIMQAADCLHLITMKLFLSCIYMVHVLHIGGSPCCQIYHCQVSEFGGPTTSLSCCYCAENQYIVPRQAPESTRGGMFCSSFEMQCLCLDVAGWYIPWNCLSIVKVSVLGSKILNC